MNKFKDEDLEFEVESILQNKIMDHYISRNKEKIIAYLGDPVHFRRFLYRINWFCEKVI